MLNLFYGELLNLVHNHHAYTKIIVTECYSMTNEDFELEIKTDKDYVRLWIPKKELRKDQNGQIWLSIWYYQNSKLSEI